MKTQNLELIKEFIEILKKKDKNLFNKFINLNYDKLKKVFYHKSLYYFQNKYNIFNEEFNSYFSMALIELFNKYCQGKIIILKQTDVIGFILIYIRNNLLNLIKRENNNISIDGIYVDDDDVPSNNIIDYIYSKNIDDNDILINNEIEKERKENFEFLLNKIANILMLNKHISDEERKIYKLYFLENLDGKNIKYKDLVHILYNINVSDKKYMIYEQRIKNKIRKIRKIIYENIDKKILSKYIKNNIKF